VLHTYVLRELLSPFLSATAVLLSLFYAMVLVRGVEFLLGSAAEPSDWLMLGLALLPMLLPQVLPISLLLGVMIGFARLGEDGELTALASVGVSARQLARPALVLGAGVCVLLSITIFFWKPWGIAQMRQTAREVIERNVLGDLKPGTVRADLPGIVFHAEAVAEASDDRRPPEGDSGERIKTGPVWRQVLLIDERDPARVSVLSAPVAQASFEHGVGMHFTDGVLVQRASAQEYSTTSFKDGTLLFNVADALNRRNTFRFGHEELSPMDLFEAAKGAEASGAPSSSYWSAFHFRLSQLLAPAALAVLATAVAQGGRRRAVRTAALIALGTYLGFYVFSRVGVQLGERGLLPAWVAGHLPTVAAFAFGIWLLLRVEKRGAR
jgi:lipopolysaccharide export LptBFGC system permease protein LptF